MMLDEAKAEMEARRASSLALYARLYAKPNTTHAKRPGNHTVQETFRLAAYASLLGDIEDCCRWLNEGQYQGLVGSFGRYIPDPNWMLWGLEGRLLLGRMESARELAQIMSRLPIRQQKGLVIHPQRAAFRTDLLDYLVGHVEEEHRKEHRWSGTFQALRAKDEKAFAQEAVKNLKSQHSKAVSKRSLDWNGPRGFLAIEVLILLRLAHQEGFDLSAVEKHKARAGNQTVKLVSSERPKTEVSLQVDYLPPYLYKTSFESPLKRFVGSDQQDLARAELHDRLNLLCKRGDLEEWHPDFNWERGHYLVALGKYAEAREAFLDFSKISQANLSELSTAPQDKDHRIERYTETLWGALLSGSEEQLQTVLKNPVLEHRDTTYNFLPRHRGILPVAFTLLLRQEAQKALEFVEMLEGREIDRYQNVVRSLCAEDPKNITKSLNEFIKKYHKSLKPWQHSRDHHNLEVERYFCLEAALIVIIARRLGVEIDINFPANQVELDLWYLQRPLPKDLKTASIELPPIPKELVNR